MAIKLRNQRPAELYSEPFDILPEIDPMKPIVEYTEDIENHIDTKYIESMFNPINNTQPVVIEDVTKNGNTPIDKGALFSSIMHLWTSDTIDVTLQDQVVDIYRQGMMYHSPNDWYFEEQLGVEALTRINSPLPSQTASRIVKYGATTDVIPAAKNLLANGDADATTNWFANMVGYVHNRPFNDYILLTVESADVFNDYKQQVRNFIQMWQAQTTINTDVVNLLSDFDKIDLTNDLSAGIFLPNGGGKSQVEQEALSFTRIVMYTLANYEKANNGKITAQPINMQQIYTPENIIIINLENYAHAKGSDIKKDWDDLEKAMNTKTKLNFVSNKRLMTAKAVVRSTRNGPRVSSSQNQSGIERTRIKRFSGKPIPAKYMLNMMKMVIESQITKQVTQNTYTTTKTSYMRPNRRKPDDMNLPGKITTTRYRPDIHIYIDTSGSISESQYRDAVTNIIMLSKRIDCNLYISSFSHIISQTSLLMTKDRSTQNIYAQFLSVPKVSGGTDFEQVWKKIDMIDAVNKRNYKSHQINFVITDFGYSLSSGHKWNTEQASLKHTYYVPISVDRHTWKYITQYGTMFRKQMAKAGDYGIRRRMLM